MSTRFGRWLFAPRAPTALAVMRIATGCYGLALLVFTSRELRALGRLDPARFDPVGIVAVTGVSPASTSTITVWLALGALTGVAFSAGWWYRISGPAFAICLCWLTTYQNSWSKLLHTENLLVIHVLVLAVAPAADVLVVRRRLGRRADHPPSAYGWPLRALALATVLTYLAAGITKLRHAGWAWLDPDNLRNWIAYDLVRKELFGDPYLPIAFPALERPWMLAPAIVLALAIELGAPVALLGRRIATVWVVGAWTFHVAVLASMSVLFPYQLVGVAFLPVLLAAGCFTSAAAVHDPTPDDRGPQWDRRTTPVTRQVR